MQHSRLRLVLLLVASLPTIFVPSCRPTTPGVSGSAPPSVISPESRPISLILPIDFFPPEQKRLSQHLGWQTGCFQLQNSRPNAIIGYRTEIWRRGKPEKPGHFSTSSGDVGEISISVREETMPGKPSIYRVTKFLAAKDHSSGTSSTFVRPQLAENLSTTVAQISAPVELIPGQAVAVWALILSNSDSADPRIGNPKPNVTSQAAAAEWALVLKIAVDPPLESTTAPASLR